MNTSQMGEQPDAKSFDSQLGATVESPEPSLVEKGATVAEPETKARRHISRSRSYFPPPAQAVQEEEDLPCEETYPEGGLAAYLVVLGSFAGMLACFGLMNTVGVFQAYLSRNQLASYSESEIGWIFSLYVFLSFFCGVQIGPVFDAQGPRWLILAGSICLIAGVMGVAESTKYYEFIITFSVLGGLGTSLIFTPAISAIGHWFRAKRGAATGLAATGGSVGGVIFPLMLQKLFINIGFAWATRIMGFIMLFLVILANLLIRSRLPPKPHGSVWPDFSIFGNRIFALTTASVFFIEWGLFIPISYITLYSIRYGIDEQFSYQIITILNAGSFFGRWTPGYFADRFGRFNTLVVTVLLCLVSVFAIWLPANGNVAATVVFSLIFGFASGSNISLAPVCVGQLCDTNEYGRWYATCYTVVSFSCLTGIPLAGQILSIDGGSYWGLIIFTGACYVAALFFCTMARVLVVGPGLTKIY
ncbi:hypothetical protein MMC25_004737 [Agyrium rufum]|nr:hypothetical protein [Agyrium rufum]